MMFYEFHTRTYGKWILAGEHAVLRGHPALVFPLKSHQLALHFDPQQPLGVSFDQLAKDAEPALFWKIMDKGLALSNHAALKLQGHFTIESTIPLGAGMGASAALCTAVARWFIAQGLITRADEIDFARNLEHLFHGQSSGLDIAGSAAESGLFFHAGHGTPLQQAWQPILYLSTSGQTSVTGLCIEQVGKIWQKSPTTAQGIDEKMHQAVLKAQQALEEYTDTSLVNLKAALQESCTCFEEWGLLSPPLMTHIKELYAAGALAVKPTGSGKGGYVLSLWGKAPDREAKIDVWS